MEQISQASCCQSPLGVIVEAPYWKQRKKIIAELRSAAAQESKRSLSKIDVTASDIEQPRHFERLVNVEQVWCHRPWTRWPVPLVLMVREFGSFVDTFRSGMPEPRDCALARSMCELASEVSLISAAARGVEEDEQSMHTTAIGMCQPAVT